MHFIAKDYLTKFRINVRDIIWSEKDRNAIATKNTSSNER